MSLSALKVLLKFLTHVDGRDKGLKLVQYTTKLVVYGIDPAKPKPAILQAPQELTEDAKLLLQRLNKLAGAFSVSRKVMRLSNWLDGLARIAALINDPSSLSWTNSDWNEQFWQGLDLFGILVGFLTNATEDLATLGSIGTLSKRVHQRFEPLSAQLWLLSIVINITQLMRDLKAVNEEEREWRMELEAQVALKEAKEYGYKNLDDIIGSEGSHVHEASTECQYDHSDTISTGISHEEKVSTFQRPSPVNTDLCRSNTLPSPSSSRSLSPFSGSPFDFSASSSFMLPVSAPSPRNLAYVHVHTFSPPLSPLYPRSPFPTPMNAFSLTPRAPGTPGTFPRSRTSLPQSHTSQPMHGTPLHRPTRSLHHSFTYTGAHVTSSSRRASSFLATPLRSSPSTSPSTPAPCTGISAHEADAQDETNSSQIDSVSNLYDANVSEPHAGHPIPPHDQSMPSPFLERRLKIYQSLLKLIADGGFCTIDVFSRLQKYRYSLLVQIVCGLVAAWVGSVKRWNASKD